MSLTRPDGEGGTLLPVKAVPRASRDQIAGPVGDRLKVRIAAPPEDGRANASLCAIIAGALGISESDVSVVHGAASAQKTLRIRALAPAAVSSKLGI